MKRVIRILFIYLALITTFFSCQKDPEPEQKQEPVSVSGISLDVSSLTLTEGDSKTLTVTVSPSNAANKTVIWSSSDGSIASVDNNGKVTAVKAGTATVTATTSDGGKTASCTVTVNAKTYPVESVSLDKSNLELTEGESSLLQAVVKPDNATDKGVSWSSSNPDVAVVDNSGKVTAVKAGTATVTATTSDGGKTASCTVTVNAKTYPVESVSLDKSNLELTEGESSLLQAVVKPDNATDKGVSWSSSNPDVAVVDNSGKVTAVKAGTATVTATTSDGGKTASCTVTVNAKTYPVESVSLDKSSLELTEGESSLLQAVVKPDNATDKGVSWSSSNPDVAVVDNSGKVTAVKAGTATVTATTSDGGKTASCTVTVKEKKKVDDGGNEDIGYENW